MSHHPDDITALTAAHAHATAKLELLAAEQEKLEKELRGQIERLTQERDELKFAMRLNGYAECRTERDAALAKVAGLEALLVKPGLGEVPKSVRFAYETLYEQGDACGEHKAAEDLLIDFGSRDTALKLTLVALEKWNTCRCECLRKNDDDDFDTCPDALLDALVAIRLLLPEKKS